MRKQHQQTTNQLTEEKRKPTPTFLLEVPLRVTASQAKRLRAHLEAARQLYNAVFSEGQRRVRRMRADPAWQPPAPFLAPRSWTASALLASCEGAMGFPSTRCTTPPKA